ncbi:DNA-3-methyladenine glycosylase 2 [Frigoribacterium salinisoli]
MTVVRSTSLPVAGPWDLDHALGLLAGHAVPGAELVDRAACTHARVVPRGVLAPGSTRDADRTSDPGGAGDPGHVRLDLRLATDHVHLTATPAGGARLDDEELAGLVDVVRRWLDLDADLDAVAATFARDDVLGPSLARRPGIRVTGHPVGWEAAAATVLGQQVSLAAARTFAGRLVSAHGVAAPGAGGLLAWPSARTVADVDVDELRAAVGVTNARARTLHAVAAAFADGLEVHPGADRAEARRTLLALPGVGPWTVEYLAVRALGDRDAWPSGDLVLRRALGGRTAREVDAAGAAWSPHRAYALFHLWADALG